MKKRIIIAILAVVMILNLSTVVFAAEPEKNASLLNERIVSFVKAKLDTDDAKIKVDRVKTVVDFAGNKYKVVECEPTGYFIIHPESGILIEYSVNAKSPYKGIESDMYYGGPTYYYVKSGEKYIHTVLDTAIDKNELEATVKDCNKLKDELVSQTNNSAAQYFTGESTALATPAISRGTDYWVTSYTWLKNLTSYFGYYCPPNSDGICGYVAANIVLKYWHYRGTIELEYPYYITSQVTLTAELRKIGGDLGYGDSTWAYPIYRVINEFCSQQSLPEEAGWAIGVSGITTEIGTNHRPCILFGNLSGAGNHAVVAYGYNTYENPGYYTFVCHYGWNEDDDGSYSEVHVYGGTSIFGSNTKYRV